MIASGVTAQEPGDATLLEAKRLFDKATLELDAGRADIGRDLLRRSLALHPGLATRYNLGVALRRTGQTTEAVAMFEGLVREPTLGEAERAEIATKLDETRAELSTITVRVTGAPQALIEIDAREVDTIEAETPTEFVVDAGEHVVIARAGGSSRQSVVVERGQTAFVDLHVLSLQQQTAVDRRKRRRKRATWIASATAVVAAVVLGSVLGTRKSGPKPGDTPVFPTLFEQP